MGRRSRWVRYALSVVALVATSSVSGADGTAAVIRTQKLEFTGIAAGATEGRTILRTQKMEFTGTHTGERR